MSTVSEKDMRLAENAGRIVLVSFIAMIILIITVGGHYSKEHTLTTSISEKVGTKKFTLEHIGKRTSGEKKHQSKLEEFVYTNVFLGANDFYKVNTKDKKTFIVEVLPSKDIAFASYEVTGNVEKAIEELPIKK